MASPSIFPNQAQAVASLRADRLMRMAKTYFPDVTFSDAYLWEKLRAAEKDLERALRVFFTPREMIPPGTPQDERDRLLAEGKVLEEEPGYDYDPAMFQGNTWGHISLRQRPAQAVHRIWFAYPQATSDIWVVPPAWVRLDKKYGRISLLPGDGLMTVPLNAYILRALGGGRTVPLMMQIRYTAGLVDAAENYPDLLDLIKKSAVLAVIEDEFLPQGGSISADGLSQSLSWDAEKQREALAPKINRLRDAIHGIRVVAL